MNTATKQANQLSVGEVTIGPDGSRHIVTEVENH